MNLRNQLREKARYTLPSFDPLKKQRECLLFCPEEDEATRQMCEELRAGVFAYLVGDWERDVAGSAGELRERLGELALEYRRDEMGTDGVYLLLLGESLPQGVLEAAREWDEHLPLVAEHFRPIGRPLERANWLRMTWLFDPKETDGADIAALLLAMGAYRRELPAWFTASAIKAAAVKARLINAAERSCALQLRSRMETVYRQAGLASADCLNAFSLAERERAEILDELPRPLDLPLLNSGLDGARPAGEAMDIFFGRLKEKPAPEWLLDHASKSLHKRCAERAARRAREVYHLPLQTVVVHIQRMLAGRITEAEQEQERADEGRRAALWAEVVCPDLPALPLALKQYFDRWEESLRCACEAAWWKALDSQLVNQGLLREAGTTYQTMGRQIRWLQRFAGDSVPNAPETRSPASGWNSFDLGRELRGLAAAADFEESALSAVLEQVEESAAEWHGGNCPCGAILLYDPVLEGRLLAARDRAGTPYLQGNRDNGFHTRGSPGAELAVLPSLGEANLWAMYVKSVISED